MATSRLENCVQTSGNEEETEVRWAESIVELAGVLGVSRQTIYDWQKRDGCPGARSNGKWNVAEWREFQRLISETGDSPDEKDRKRKLEEAMLAEKLRQLKKKGAREDGLWSRNDLVATDARRLADELRTLLEDLLDRGRLADRVVGRTIEEIRVVCREEYDRICRRLSTGAEDLAEKYGAL